MNIDERLEKLTKRHEALAMNLELFGKDLEAMAERSDKAEKALREDLDRLASAVLAVNEKTGVALNAVQKLAELVEKVNDRAVDADEKALKADERARKADERAQEASALADKNTLTIQALIRVAEGHANRIIGLEGAR